MPDDKTGQLFTILFSGPHNYPLICNVLKDILKDSLQKQTMQNPNKMWCTNIQTCHQFVLKAHHTSITFATKVPITPMLFINKRLSMLICMAYRFENYEKEIFCGH